LAEADSAHDHSGVATRAADATEAAEAGAFEARAAPTGADEHPDRGKTVHGEPADAGHRVLAPDDAEVEAYLETALKAPSPMRDGCLVYTSPSPRDA
jgi:hypothetical protein